MTEHIVNVSDMDPFYDHSQAANQRLEAATKQAESGDTIKVVGDLVVDYGLTWGCRNAKSRLHPYLGAYTPNDLTLDLREADIQLGVVKDVRTRYGASILTVNGGNNNTVLGGTLSSTNVLGKDSVLAGLEPWHAVHLIGVKNFTMDGTIMRDIWGDFVYINHGSTTWSENVRLANLDCKTNGRQGVTMNAVDWLEIEACDFWNVQRCLFDHEPDRRGRLTNVVIRDCTGNGGLLFANFRPLLVTEIGNISIENHYTKGHFKIRAKPGLRRRQSFAIRNSRSDSERIYIGELMNFDGMIFGWNDLIIEVIERVKDPTKSIKTNRCNDVAVSVTSPQ